jgi:hypothetical protein
VEGHAELVSDLVLRCSGGSPTPAGQQIPVANIQLTLNTNITSLPDSGSAKLVIEGAVPAVYTAHAGDAANIVTWRDVPLDAPGASAERVIRLTNIRADVCLQGLSSTLAPSPIAGFVQVARDQPVTVDHPQQTLAYIKQGLFVNVGQNTASQQCVNRSFSDGPVNHIVLREGFARSFAGAHILIRFSNAGAGIAIVVPEMVLLTRGATGDWSGGYLQLLERPEAANQSTAEYEVVNSDPLVTETAEIAVAVEFVGLPAPGQVTASVSFSPLAQFCDRLKPLNVFHVDVCTCTLLFPVTQTPGFDTRIMILNATPDPFGTTPQAGPVTMWFYGDGVPRGLAVQTTTRPLASGEVLIWSARGGGALNAAGLQPMPGFRGFAIARTSFQNCHGFAFIWDLATQERVEQYPAIELLH